MGKLILAKSGELLAQIADYDVTLVAYAHPPLPGYKEN
jgi:hypothetical protein